MPRTKGIHKRDFFLLWLINPFLSLVYLLRNFGRHHALWPFLLVSFFFGFSFVIDPASNADSTRYARDLRLAYEEQATFQEYVLERYLGNDGGELDIYQPTLTWLVSLFTSDYRWLFAAFAAIFGYFWFKSLLLIRQHLSSNLTTLSIILLVTLAVINPIWSINGVRMWTAIQLFFYGFLVLHLQNKTQKAWLLMASAPFIHFSLAFALLVYVPYHFFPAKNTHLLFIFYLASLFISEVDYGLLREQFEKLPAFLQSKKTYLGESYIEGWRGQKTDLAWHVTFAQSAQKYAMIFMVIWVYLKGFWNRNLNSDVLRAIFLFTLFFSAVANLATNIPSGARFMILSHLLTGLSFLLFLKQTNQKFHPILKSFLQGALLFVIVFRVRVGMDHVGAFFFFGNPLINLFIVDDVPFITFIKEIVT
jgi:hypothetical protein